MRDSYCPYCGGTEMVEAKYGAVYGESAWSGQIMYHTVCRKCGSVVRSFVKEPEKLLKRKNRKKEWD